LIDGILTTAQLSDLRRFFGQQFSHTRPMGGLIAEGWNSYNSTASDLQRFLGLCAVPPLKA